MKRTAERRAPRLRMRCAAATIALLALTAGCGDDGEGRAAATPRPTLRASITPTSVPTANARATATETQTASATETATATPTPTEATTATVTPTVDFDQPGRCDDFNPQRNLYFGDLHVHTTYSFDAQVYDVGTTPADAYRFAHGEPLSLPPLDAEGNGTQTLRLDRPLDFAVVTDHSEYLGEVEVCTVPGAPGYDSHTCAVFRSGGAAGQAIIGLSTAMEMPTRAADVCGEDGSACRAALGEVWNRIVEAAEAAYDRSSQCAFTTFIAYEYTANTGISSRHRNVIFRNDDVPLPISYIDQPTPQGLWEELRRTCTDAGGRCAVLAIPHNSNQSNGNLFRVEYDDGRDLDAQRAAARAHAAFEPLMEIYQHKGDSECSNGLSGIEGPEDPLCDFEKLRQPPFEDCGDGVGNGGTANSGCVSRRDFARGALLEGLRERDRIGVNPFELGFVGGTDTHNGTPGAVDEQTFIGHRGSADATIEQRLGAMSFRSGVVFGPGGLTAVWAEENSRPAIFAALQRREVYATSGPRIAVRFFGGWGLDAGLCDDPQQIAKAYDEGVPMGAVLPARPGGEAAPSFLVTALRDPSDAKQAAPLGRIQIIKGWVADGVRHQMVYDVATAAGADAATVDTATCDAVGNGAASLCSVWRDPDFDPSRQAFYYARVVQNPTCRWTGFTCSSLPPAERPAACSDPDVPMTMRERAWTSPIWYEAVESAGVELRLRR
jgi:Protein of unknown function (DUF3604)